MHHRNPSLLGFLIWCAIDGAIAATVATSAARAAVPFAILERHRNSGLVAHQKLAT